VKAVAASNRSRSAEALDAAAEEEEGKQGEEEALMLVEAAELALEDERQVGRPVRERNGSPARSAGNSRAYQTALETEDRLGVRRRPGSSCRARTRWDRAADRTAVAARVAERTETDMAEDKEGVEVQLVMVVGRVAPEEVCSGCGMGATMAPWKAVRASGVVDPGT
jgi:hypothetical protein